MTTTDNERARIDGAEMMREAAAKPRKFEPCPFCGARPHHGLTKVKHCQLHGEPYQHFEIWCPNGHAKITAADEARARDIWNKRPSLEGRSEPVGCGPNREATEKLIQELKACADDRQTPGAASVLLDTAASTLESFMLSAASAPSSGGGVGERQADMNSRLAEMTSLDDFQHEFSAFIERAEKTVSLENIIAELVDAQEQLQMRVDYPEAFEAPTRDAEPSGSSTRTDTAVQRVAAFLKERDEAFVVTDEQTDEERLESARQIAGLFTDTEALVAERSCLDLGNELADHARRMCSLNNDDATQHVAWRGYRALVALQAERDALKAEVERRDQTLRENGLDSVSQATALIIMLGVEKKHAEAQRDAALSALNDLDREIGEWEMDGPGGPTTVSDFIRKITEGVPTAGDYEAHERVMSKLDEIYASDPSARANLEKTLKRSNATGNQESQERDSRGLPDGCCGYTDSDGLCCTPMPKSGKTEG